MKLSSNALTLAALISFGLTGGALAQTTTTTDVAGHPRINEVDQRLQNQENRVDAGVANGTINAKQEARDDARDAKVSQQLSKDEAKNAGHITKAEDRRMNKELNKNSKRIHSQRTKTPVTAQ